MTRSDAVENRALILHALGSAIKSNSNRLPTMSDLIQQTGLGRGTVYRHFGDIGELYYAYLQDGYTKLCCTYEPEWIEGGIAEVKDRFRVFLTDYIKYNVENHSILSTIDCLTSESRKLAKIELRRKIFVTATKISKKPLRPIELSKWADIIAHCVETEHLQSHSRLEVIPELSIGIAMSLLENLILTHEGADESG